MPNRAIAAMNRLVAMGLRMNGSQIFIGNSSYPPGDNKNRFFGPQAHADIRMTSLSFFRMLLSQHLCGIVRNSSQSLYMAELPTTAGVSSGRADVSASSGL